MKALIVDPSRLVRTILGSAFAKNNVEPVKVCSGGEALEALAAGGVDFLCFALEVGDMDGIEFYMRAKAAGLLGKHPAVMVTSITDDEVAAKALTAGVTEIFLKSEIEQFEEYVSKWATRARSRVAGEALLVEDSRTMAEVCRRILVAAGLQVTWVCSGEEAVAACAEHDFDIVITDYLLEGKMTGLNTIRALRAMPGRRGTVPILAMSALENPARRIEILRSGANDFVAKPVMPEELEVRVRNLVTMRELFDRLEEQHQLLREMAHRDRLTSLYNRHYLSEAVPPMFAEASRKQAPVSVIVVDVDFFKRVNDTHGHAVGDDVLVRVAHVLDAPVGAKRIALRTGGEEFLLLLPGADLDAAAAEAERLRAMVEHLRPAGLSITASLGVATRRPDEAFDPLFSRADAAVYRAKERGRNCVVSERDVDGATPAEKGGT